MLHVRSWNVVLLSALASQIMFAGFLRDVRAFREILPPAPTDASLAASAFGDREFLYRRLAMDLQNFGDTGGRIVPLREYDMSRVVDWLTALDKLDASAQHHIVLAARYFAQTQDTPQLIHLVRYLQRHVERDPKRGLPWLIEAIYMARKLGDERLTLELADQLASYDFPEMTVIAYQLPAILHGKAGEFDRARLLMERALRLTAHEASTQDQAFMRTFIDDMKVRVEVEKSDGRPGGSN